MRFVDDAEAAVLAAAKEMLRRGLVEGTAGNISARREDATIVITPSSVDYRDMTVETRRRRCTCIWRAIAHLTTSAA